MTLAELLEQQFRGDVRFRGEAYLKAERVAITHVSAEAICGSVRDGAEHQTQLTRIDGGVKLFCSCQSNGSRKSGCKHLWATVLAADSGGYVSGAVKPGNVPPFVVDDVEEPFLFDDDDELDRPSHRPTASRSVARPEADVEPPRKRKPWESRLDDLRERMSSGLHGSHGAGQGERVDREILYEIDAEASEESSQLVVEVQHRQRRASGQWGRSKPLRLKADGLEDVENELDRRILAFLIGAIRQATQSTSRAGSPTTVCRFQIPHELAVLVVPPMCETERLVFRQKHAGRSSPLQWDEGPPWELLVAMEPDQKEEGWNLSGRLTRPDAVLPLNKAELVLPGGLLIHAGKLSLVEDFNAFDWIAALNLKEGAVVPADDGEEFVDRLLDMPALPRLELPEPLRLEEIRGEPSPYLFLRTPAVARRRWQSDKLDGEVRFEYAGAVIPASSSQWAIVQRDAGRCLLRDSKREEQLWGELQEAGFRRIRDRRRGEYDATISVRDLGAAVRRLVVAGWQVRADGKPVRQPASLQFRVRSHVDWFELQADVQFESNTVAFPELLSALARGDNTVRLDDGSIGILPEDWIQQYGLLAGLAEIDGDTVRLAHNQIALLDALLTAQGDVDFDAQFAEMRERIRNFAGIDEHSEPENFRGKLRKYQREGLGWLDFLREFRFGGCLADDMGLGKTIQVLALLVKRAQSRGEHLPSLVVVPKSLIFNWRRECRRFAPKLKVLEYVGLKRAELRKELASHDVVLTTYGTLRRDVLSLKDVQFDYAILDEAQTIKNAGSQVAKASRLIQARHRVALSGTPIENHLGDLWSIFEFLNPGMLGRSAVFRSYTSENSDDASRNLLARALTPFILRRTKKEVANELPDKFEHTLVCRMGADQRRLYNELREHYRQSLLGMVADKGINKTKMHVLEALLRLRQAACHPGLLDDAKREDHSAKLDVLMPRLQELLDEGHKALVFSQFTSMLSIVREQLDRKEVVYEYLDGQTRNRESAVQRFQTDPDCGLFLISLKAGGLGLNLTAADYVFLLDPWWNPAAETQAIDRAHRVGQTRHVFAYRLICQNTVEEKIAKLQKQKKSLAEAILSADSSLLKNLTTDDLELLLS